MFKNVFKIKLYSLISLCLILMSCSTIKHRNITYFDNLNQNIKCDKIDYEIINQKNDTVEISINISGIRNPEISPLDPKNFSCIHIVDDEIKNLKEYLVLILPDDSDLTGDKKNKNHLDWIPFELKILHHFKKGQASDYYIKCDRQFKEISELKIKK